MEINVSKISVKYQAKTPRSLDTPTNTRINTKNYIYAWHNQTAENQRQKDILEISQKKGKEKRKKKLIYRGTRIRITLIFSLEIMQAGRKQSESFKILKEKNCQFRILYPVKLTSKMKEK